MPRLRVSAPGSVFETALAATAWLSLPFGSPANRAEKYFDLAPAAMHAVARTGQDDRATIDALIARLDRDDDPDWLQGDVVGALGALTGERLAYDTEAWRAWWENARPQWPLSN